MSLCALVLCSVWGKCPNASCFYLTLFICFANLCYSITSNQHHIYIEMSLKLINPATISVARLAARRWLSTTVQNNNSTKSLMDMDPNNYSVPLRPSTMDDTMEPYGSWKIAYEAERRRGNRMLFTGILCFSASCLLLVKSGVFDGAIMPNLDNIMEETEPFDFDKEGRVTV